MADTTSPSQQTYLTRLRQGEQHALWKLSLRAIIIILDLIGIGTAGWMLSNALSFRANPYIGYFSGAEASPWILLVCGISLLFCLICMLVLLLRRPPRPAHPGIAVGVDLILWMAFIITALFTTVAVIALARWGDDKGYLEDPSYASDYSGSYYLNKANNTWIYNVTSTSSSPGYSVSYGASNDDYGGYFWNTTRDDWQRNLTRPATASVQRDCSDSDFASCAAQDAYINKLWHSKPRRLGTVTLAAVAQWLNVVLHFVLFVWACVDTHRRNMAKRTGRVDAVAERVVRDLQARGLVVVDPAQAGRAAGLPEGQPLMSERSAEGGGGLGAAGESEERQKPGDAGMARYA